MSEQLQFLVIEPFTAACRKRNQGLRYQEYWDPFWESAATKTSCDKRYGLWTSLYCWISPFNPLLPDGNYSYFTNKISLKKRDHEKNFLWAPRLWGGRRWDPLLGYILKFNGKKVSGGEGLKGWHRRLLLHNCTFVTIVSKGCKL